MSFFVDIVTEDSFYENLTLGIIKILEGTPCVKNVQVERRLGCDRSALATWEQRHCCVFPDDLRNFYASVDGFLLTWSFEISGEEFPLGRLEVGALAELKRFVGTKEQQSEAEASLPQNSDVPSLSSKCKLFELGQCGPSKVYLAYTGSESDPGIWLHDEKSARWFQLADNFTKYFRMLLVHLGLPFWQYCAVGLPTPTWVEQVYLLVGPHLLPTTVKPLQSVSTTLWNEGPLNSVDPAIFKSKENKQRNTRKK
ncbi:tubulin polyglutamylase complex subunit 2 [Athalia rosae]|uniref:tubulin polyglutamylase complex subunit 2 n=1 Tax=Athalia rosae TaxID=37344 RepID=UPI0020332AAD|nr:tubulin polyglutamylase complex subunit 2 [Athalia rosae]XP_048514029.1 tubulin polyglutamylase complex subunit 2 [Athalia rosae]